MTHVVLRFSKPVTVRGELVESLFRASTGLRQAQAERRLVIFVESISYVSEVDNHYPEFPIPATE